MTDRDIYKCKIIADLLEGREPDYKNDYANVLTCQEYGSLVNEMQNEGLIRNAKFSEDGNSPKNILIVWLDTAEVTPKGKSFYEL